MSKDITHKMENNKYESYTCSTYGSSTYASTHAGSYESGYDSEPGLSSSHGHLQPTHDDRIHAKDDVTYDDVRNFDNANVNVHDNSDWSENDFFYEEEFNRFNYDIENLEELCQSANGVVYTGKSISTGDDVIVKKIWKENVAEVHQWEGRECPNEVYFHLRSFEASPNLVVPIIDWYEFEDFYLISMVSIGECTDLFTVIRNQKSPLGESRAKTIFRQLCAVAYDLHKAKICHRDLKDENILIDRNDRIYLIDFGTTMDYDSSYSDCVGTPCFFAPEYYYAGYFRPEELTTWSLGAILYIMLAKYWRWSNTDESWQRSEKDESSISVPTKAFLDQILNESPDKRLKLLDIVNSDWLNSE
jgi:serine/threonine protein kinase